MDLPDVAVVSVDDPIGVVDLLDTIQGTDFCLNGDTLIHRGYPGSFTVVIGVQAVAFNILFRLPEAHANPGPQADIPATGTLFNNVLNGLQEFGVGLAT
ncbi:hypothetical protein MTAT_30170 [Moorella thermoacetica]|uniref:Uncharacterized protein n=1 Tax=Neomoorella thermoacetica TaxID=1525 RepID=A0ABY3N1X1_NEOTH|nr:hypothetical protein MTAT_30170 [Moorella thermoacetica]